MKLLWRKQPFDFSNIHPPPFKNKTPVLPSPDTCTPGQKPPRLLAGNFPDGQDRRRLPVIGGNPFVEPHGFVLLTAHAGSAEKMTGNSESKMNQELLSLRVGRFYLGKNPLHMLGTQEGEEGGAERDGNLAVRVGACG